MIEIESLTKTYGRRARPVHALRGVSLDIGAGVTAVVGPNGAGKTTLLALVLGFLHPTSGSVRIRGERPRRYLRRHGTGYLPERFQLPAEWPTASALHALARLERLDPDDASARATATLDQLGLAPHAHKPFHALSRGLRQRLGLAQALLAARDLVVLDEPTEGLDPLWRVRFREIVGALRDRGATVLLASHELAEVQRIADRVILLDDGRVREVIELGRPATGPVRYRLDVAGAPAAIAAAFPAAEPAEPAAPAADAEEAAARPGGPAGASLVVTVADAEELSTRLAAFLAEGGVLRAATPLDRDLEARVRQRLGEP